MTPGQFLEDLKRKAQELENFKNRTFPIKAGAIGVEHFKENFAKEGFVDNGLHKWQEVKRRDPQSPWYGFAPDNKDRFSSTKAKNKILHDSGHLESSFKKQTAPGEATVQNTAEYAEVHNEGLSAKIFGKTEFKMPRRQFVGHSAELDEKVNNMISAELNKIL